MNIQKGLIRSLYGLRNRKITKCDLVVALGYGLTQQNRLPDAEIEVLLKAGKIAQEYDAILVWASSNYLFKGSDEIENTEKCAFLEAREFFPKQLIVAPPITNSVTEALEIRDHLECLKLDISSIVVVLHWAHARSARIIWKKVFPKKKIIIESVDGEWDESHRADLQRSNLKWLGACILRHGALRILGMRWVAARKHPITPLR